jgi:hypothetical protein
MSTDKGSTIIIALLQHLRDHRIIVPAPASIEGIGLAGRARSRRLTADAMIVGLGAAKAACLDDLLVNDPKGPPRQPSFSTNMGRVAGALLSWPNCSISKHVCQTLRSACSSG